MGPSSRKLCFLWGLSMPAGRSPSWSTVSHMPETGAQTGCHNLLVSLSSLIVSLSPSVPLYVGQLRTSPMPTFSHSLHTSCRRVHSPHPQFGDYRCSNSCCLLALWTHTRLYVVAICWYIFNSDKWGINVCNSLKPKRTLRLCATAVQQLAQWCSCNIYQRFCRNGTNPCLTTRIGQWVLLIWDPRTLFSLFQLPSCSFSTLNFIFDKTMSSGGVFFVVRKTFKYILINESRSSKVRGGHEVRIGGKRELLKSDRWCSEQYLLYLTL